MTVEERIDRLETVVEGLITFLANLEGVDDRPGHKLSQWLTEMMKDLKDDDNAQFNTSYIKRRQPK